MQLPINAFKVKKELEPLYHFLMGEHSNIPACCIAYWANMHDKRHRVGETPGYARCDNCFNNKIRRNRIHRCTEKCNDFYKLMRELLYEERYKCQG